MAYASHFILFVHYHEYIDRISYRSDAQPSHGATSYAISILLFAKIRQIRFRHDDAIITIDDDVELQAER